MHEWLNHLTQTRCWQTNAYWGGAWHPGSGRFPVRNPATGETIAEVADCGRSETEAAIDAATHAFATWKNTLAKERSALLRQWHARIIENAEPLAQLITLECGKPLAEARGEVAYAASFVEWFAEEAKRVYGDLIPTPQADRRLMAWKQPVGVCAAITPWNFPAAMITRKVAPALAVGCTVVVKPAEQTPLTALALAALAEDAGFPAGVFNVITGSRPEEIGETLTASPIVRKLSFTGSTEVGRLLMAQCAPTLKRLSFELGGNAPFIVFDDADLDAAVAGALASKYRNAGQTCVCANRLIVQEGIYDAFAERFAAEVAKLRVGPGWEAGVAVGPLIDAAAVAKVTRLVEEAVSRGAQVRCGGHLLTELGNQFYAPTVLTNVTAEMAIASEEIFGPVAPIYRFRTDDEAVALANATEYGLAAYFYARDVGRVWRVAEQLDYGMIGINTGIISSEVFPFGGVKQSGFGREGSKYGVDEYLEVKAICLAGV